MSTGSIQGETTPTTTVAGSGDSRGGSRLNRTRRPRKPLAGDNADRPNDSNQSGTPSNTQPRPKKKKHRVRDPEDKAIAHHNVEGHSGASDEKHAKQGKKSTPRHPRPQSETILANNEETNVSRHPGRPSNKTRRAPRFGTGLTDEKLAGSSQSKQPTKASYAQPKRDDLTSTLIYDLSVPPYPDCLICFSAIKPHEPTFSCSPTIPIAGEDNDGSPKNTAVTAQCCWTTFHLKCIKAWASKSVKDTEAAWKARGEDRVGVWRCPGCQSQRNIVPSVYRCFCGSTTEPRPPRLATPHSCASQCTRPRTCSHSCPLPCHPGPCPPCQVTTQMPCFCGKKTLSFRCGILAQSRATALSCNQTCGRLLDCGNHTCESSCHDGPCVLCHVKETWSCYCGKEERELRCGDGEAKVSIVNENGNERSWTGRFACENECLRPFDCGAHYCTQQCHVPSPSPAQCPRSPSLVWTCPCGKHALQPSSAVFFSANAVLERSTCTDPIPICESICAKPLGGCSHHCASQCHTGPCPPCSVKLVRPCRCGSSTHEICCSEDQARSTGELSDILCDKACPALRACGRHQCNRVCCPLASLASTGKGKGKKKAVSVTDHDAIVDEAGWHTCDLLCGKLLPCGNHNCEEQDHRPPCPPCLRSSFEEMICACGQTILEPPIPCGTRMSCRYPCARPPLLCGHPKAQHACHEDPTPCPPCPFLTSKQCACGKKLVLNVRCSQEKVSCGTTCGKLLSCGFHQCERLCHGDNCGQCHAVCGKSRKLCLPGNHPCTQPCHAPAACSEADPCRSTVNISCPCGRIRQPVPCSRSTSNPAGREGSQQLKCSNECLLAKRNARLAEALGINTEARSAQVAYTDDLISFSKANVKFCLLVEKTFSDFISSDKKSQILPHMPETRRNFVHNLASMYRMDTQMVDQEPHRSVQLIRRLDSRVPSPLLSSAASTSTVPAVSLGRLAPLNASSSAQRATLPAGSSRVAAQTSSGTPSSSAGRGWTAVVAGPTVSSRPSPVPSPTAWLTEGKRPAGADTGASSRLAPPPVVSPAPVTPAGNVPDNWEDDL
ncbi:hypothetical protein BC835DRAFT_1288606 [Cytidiella melzeri]|nr:hypothetical protein BC835DRAFT_1288606 [Cytidiella melzeri]